MHRELRVGAMNQFRPLFFRGDHGNYLYGVLHYPEAGTPAPGILILPPAAQEAARVHKSLQKMATDLAKKGFFVLRFDYAGTGNSEDPASLDLQTWIADAQAALKVLSQSCGSEEIHLVGVRLGGAIAWSMDVDAKKMVLWDPIVDGHRYLRDLQDLHETIFTSGLYFRRQPAAKSRSPDELLGHWVPQSMQHSIQAFDLSQEPKVRSERLLWIDAEPQLGGCFEAHQHLLPGVVEHQKLALKCHWQSLEELENMLLGQPAARVIGAFFENEKS